MKTVLWHMNDMIKRASECSFRWWEGLRVNIVVKGLGLRVLDKLLTY